MIHSLDIEGDITSKRRALQVFRTLATTIIHFLAEIEEAQKRLFEKRKFVWKTDYLVPVGRVPRALWPEVLANTAQCAEWKSILALRPSATLFNVEAVLNESVLEEHPTLVVDTRHFPQEFTDRLLQSIEDIEDWTDGVLIQGENFQALSLMMARYREQTKCIYIDPPYNRNGDDFPYKDRYRHSSWLTMMLDRVALARELLRPDGLFFVSIDAYERNHLNWLLDAVFGEENRLEELVWAQNTTHSQSPLYSTNHEYVEVYARDRRVVEQAPEMIREAKPGYREVMELVARLNPEYPSVAAIEDALAALYRQHQQEFEDELRAMGLALNEETRRLDPWRGLYNYAHAEYRDIHGRYVPEEEARRRQAQIWVWQAADASAPAQKQAESTRDPNDPNYRFYRPRHPVAGRPCPHPRRGWAWPHEWPDASRDSFVKLVAEHRIAWGPDETTIPRFKRFLHEVETNVAKSFFHDYTDGEKQLAALFGQTAVFPTPKPTTLVRRFLEHAGDPEAVVLDFFAGSGTTGHAVIEMNCRDGGRRKFLLVEAADYFDTVLVPRIKKVMFAPDWEEGQPARLPTVEEVERTPRLVKILRLESYEDALHNTFSEATLERLGDRERASRALVGEDTYRLRYLVRLPLGASASMVNLVQLEHPFDYTLEILGDYGPRPETVDLVETFNWLYGLRVRRRLTWGNPDDPTPRQAGGRRYRVVVASDRDGRKQILVVWRDMTGLTAALERSFLEARVAALGAFDEQWINGDTAAKGFASLDGLFKRLVEGQG